MGTEMIKKQLAAYKFLQETPGLEMPCPRYGKRNMKSDMIMNCLSRYEDIYICNECGREEACWDAEKTDFAMEKWYAFRFLNGIACPYERKAPVGTAPYYTITASVTAEVSDQDIDDIMVFALEGGITYWCSKAEVVGETLGEYASDQISRGGELHLYDCESDEVYTLTLDKFLKGLSRYLCACYDQITDDDCIDPGEIDAERADCIIQYALFNEIVYG